MTKRLFDIYRQPEGPLSHKWEHYFDIYERYFSKFIGKPIRFLEIGVQAGGSLHMWRKYFGEQATIIGVDISPDCKQLEEDGFIIEIGDMGNIDFLRSLKKKLGEVDVILDDGSHIPKHQILALNELFPILSEGGVFLCEDVYNSYLYTRGSFVEYVKTLVDELHGWWDSDRVGKTLFPTQLTKSCGGIFFHDGIIALEKSTQDERFDLVCGDFNTAPSQDKSDSFIYLTKEYLNTLPTNSDGTTSLHKAPTKDKEKKTLKDFPPLGTLANQLAPKTIYPSINDNEAWTLCWGGEHDVKEGGLTVDGFIRSKDHFLAEAGVSYKCEFYVSASTDTTDVLPLTFYIGPITLDQAGGIIQHAVFQPELSSAEGLRKGEVIIEAEPEALAVYVGIQGPIGDPRSDALPRFEHISLTRLD